MNSVSLAKLEYSLLEYQNHLMLSGDTQLLPYLKVIQEDVQKRTYKALKEEGKGLTTANRIISSIDEQPI